MPIETYIYGATYPEDKDFLEGKVLTEPTLTYADGASNTWAVDVDIGVEGPINENGDIGLLPLRNVPLAPVNRELLYAQVGSAVQVRRNRMGKWEVVGPAKSMPGTFTIIDVELPDYCLGVLVPVIGEPYTIGIDVRALTYEELHLLGTYGVTVYGAIGVFENGVLTEIRT